jgi:exoribonuclease R
MYLETKDYKTFHIYDSSHSLVKTFVGAKNAQKCLPGDSVLPTADGCKLARRKIHPTLAGLLELSSKTKYGFTSRNHSIYLFTPYNESYPPFVVGSSERDTSQNRMALIKFDAWLETFPKGLLQELLPHDAEELALYWTYTPLACPRYKGTLPDHDPYKDHAQTSITNPKTTFHIDPPGCRDVDDVITIETHHDTTYITITIADVAAHVPVDHPLNQRAATICQTFYQDGTEPKHMFPPELSEASMSLLPSATPKLGVSLRFPLSDPSKTTWFESALITDESYTYDSVYSNAKICETLTQMASNLGTPTSDSHVWIEVAMKFYNLEAAKILRQAQKGFLRTHDAPRQTQLELYTKINPDLKFLAYASAKYVSASEATPFHYGLDAALYTHATSPIRRYADLVNQRVIKAYLNNQTSSPYAMGQFESDVVHTMNAVAKAAKQHDRDLTFIRALKTEAGSDNRVAGTVVQILDKVDPDTQKPTSKIYIYVPSWKLVVKVYYSKGPTINTVISKDETTTYTIATGQQVTLQYHVNMLARSWKKRMVLSLHA